MDHHFPTSQWHKAVPVAATQDGEGPQLLQTVNTTGGAGPVGDVIFDLFTGMETFYEGPAPLTRDSHTCRMVTTTEKRDGNSAAWRESH